MPRALSTRAVLAVLCLTAGAVATLTGCATSSPVAVVQNGSPAKILGVASISAWGSLLAQLGGDRVQTTSLIANPNTDPHDYEPTPADARLIDRARVFVLNGVGYDSWAAKAVHADPAIGRQLLDVGKITGTPADGNPHRWYSPADVDKVADAITGALQRVDPTDAAYFVQQRRNLDASGLAVYHRLISDIRARYAGTPVGASESIFAPLSDALGLDLITPPRFLKAISEGSDPAAADKATIDAELSGKRIKVYVYNRQNATPDVAAQVAAARRAGIPVCTVTETLSPAGTSFQDWQVGQLRALESALATATGH